MAFLNETKVKCSEIAVITNSQKTHEKLRCRAALRREVKLTTVPLETACPVPEPKHGSFSDCSRAPRVFRNERSQDFAVPCLGVLHIEDGMKSKIMPLLCGHAEPAQSTVDVAGASRSGHLDDAKSPDRLKRIAAVACQADHYITQR